MGRATRAAVHEFQAFWSAGSELSRGAPAIGVLQRCTPAARIIASVLLLVAVVTTHSIAMLLAIYLMCAVLALLSFIDMPRYLGKNLLIVAFFSIPVAIVGSLKVVTPGHTAVAVGGVELSRTGIVSVLFLFLRSLDAVSVTMLLMRSVGVNGLLRGLRDLRVPEEIVAALQIAIAHIHVLASTAYAMVQALRARVVAPVPLRQIYSAAGTQGAVLMRKSMHASHRVHQAMLARGFGGEFPRVESAARWRARDYALLASCAIILVIAVVL